MIDRIDLMRGDIEELRHAMATGFAAQQAVLEKSALGQQSALEKSVVGQQAAIEKAALELRVVIEQSGREQLRYFILAWGVQLAAIVGLYGTVIALVR